MPEELGGAYVSCFTIAGSYVHAVEKCLARLRANGLDVREMLDPAYQLAVSEWRLHVDDIRPDQADGLHTQEEFEQLVGEGGVDFGPFAGYNPQPG